MSAWALLTGRVERVATGRLSFDLATDNCLAKVRVSFALPAFVVPGALVSVEGSLRAGDRVVFVYVEERAGLVRVVPSMGGAAVGAALASTPAAERWLAEFRGSGAAAVLFALAIRCAS